MSVLVALAACSGVPPILPFTAGSVGTWNREGEPPGLAFIVAASPVERGTVRVILTTPDPEVLQRSLDVRPLGGSQPVSGWWVDGLAPRLGTYRLETYFPGGRSLSREMPVDPLALLPLAGSPSLTFGTQDLLLRWQAAAGARVYYAELWRFGDGDQPEASYPLFVTKALEIRLDARALSLPPGRYRGRIFALSADPSDFGHLEEWLSLPFNVSSVWTPVASWGLP
ncbi:hypothetical protein FJNA_02500 [Thermus sp. FJN-A]